jgi:hypothetical protein
MMFLGTPYSAAMKMIMKKPVFFQTSMMMMEVIARVEAAVRDIGYVPHAGARTIFAPRLIVRESCAAHVSSPINPVTV